MANTRFQLKRSTIGGVMPTTSDITTAELGLNVVDRKLFSSNGTSIFEIGSNLTSLSVGNTTTVQTLNSTGIYSTGVVNGATISVGTSFTANTTRLVLDTTIGLQANGEIGTAGQVLTSNATTVYWSTPTTGTVTSISTGNGLSGGPITTTGTVSVLANSGITANSTGTFVTQGTGMVVNATGIHVNATYIGTLSANNTTYLNGQLAAYYTNASNITTGTLPWAQAPTGTVNSSAAFTISGVHTYNANVVIGTTAGISANGTFGTAAQVLASNGTSVYWSTLTNGLNLLTTLSPANGVSTVANTDLSVTKSLIIVLNGIVLSLNGGLTFALSSNNGTNYGSSITFTSTNGTTPIGHAQIYRIDTDGVNKPYIFTSSSAGGGSYSSTTGIINALRIGISSAATFTGSGSILIYGLN